MVSPPIQRPPGYTFDKCAYIFPVGSLPSVYRETPRCRPTRKTIPILEERGDEGRSGQGEVRVREGLGEVKSSIFEGAVRGVLSTWLKKWRVL